MAVSPYRVSSFVTTELRPCVAGLRPSKLYVSHTFGHGAVGGRSLRSEVTCASQALSVISGITTDHDKIMHKSATQPWMNFVPELARTLSFPDVVRAACILRVPKEERQVLKRIFR